jgi:uncharacterized protein with ParB-like and HNH nuclease domain
MGKFWKIASRWSDNGNSDSSVLDIFRSHNIVFAGAKTERILMDVKIGDYIAISDGFKLVCICKVIQSPKKITDFNFFSDSEKKRFAFEDWVAGIKVDIVQLEKPIAYKKIGAFHELPNHTYLIKEYEMEKNKFSIDAKTYVIRDKNKKENSLINDEVKYIIPIYQRPYSWGEIEISKFISDITRSYNKENMFFGTMQFGPKMYQGEQEIIDGQQRTTTILILLKVVALKYPNKFSEFNVEWFLSKIETKVNDQSQNKLLLNFFNIASIEELNSFYEDKNRYFQNAKFIQNKIEDFLLEEFPIDDENSEINIDVQNEEKIFDFIHNHFFTKLYLVVIETKASLSKTLQIFDSINTTGLDLKGADIFKIRMYEYLKEFKDQSEECFNEINKVYENVDQIQFTDMNQILSIYQVYLIGKYDLNKTLYTFNASTFFERLFDVLFNINKYKNFENIDFENFELSLAVLQNIINSRKKFEEDKVAFSPLLRCEYSLIHWSRYGRYWLWIIIFYMEYSEHQKFAENRNNFISYLSKLTSIYSIKKHKVINEVINYFRDLNCNMLDEKISINEILNFLKIKLNSNQLEVENKLGKVIADNAKWKNIICRTSAMIEDKENSDLNKLLFETKIDIEHIQSNKDEKDFEQVRTHWGDELNSLGNLIVLEENINRSIGNRSDSKNFKYSRSKFKIMQNFRGEKFDASLWTKEKAVERKLLEIKKLMAYYFEQK